MTSPDHPARFPDFEQDPTASLLDNFRRLAIQEGWKKKSDRYKRERGVFLGQGVETAFLDTYGGNVSDLQAWQSLCKTIGVPAVKEGEPIVQLASISACQKALKGVYVNIVDLVDAATAGTVISKKFSNQKQLAKYICRSGKVFPKARAKANPLLARFLIVVGAGGKPRRKKSRGATVSAT